MIIQLQLPFYTLGAFRRSQIYQWNIELIKKDCVPPQGIMRLTAMILEN